MTKPFSKETRICLAIWRKAFQERDKEPLIINCTNYSAAISMRQAMYRAIQPFRNGKLFDEELFQAAEKLVVYLEKLDDKNAQHKLIVRPRLALDELEGQLAGLGIHASDLLLPQEKRMIEEEKTESETPFYKR